ncbi:hypothetical protein KPH14_007338 [Odynerus spinipes]|uniref:Uncharacterized protein n=1 Tax=Odynerus spinipes TaxID=1348599 RepID=A0AAD9RA37_9HYME|nr:hypothetical protein KPH14_007338 [Odynerus spinipes]
MSYSGDGRLVWQEWRGGRERAGTFCHEATNPGRASINDTDTEDIIKTARLERATIFEADKANRNNSLDPNDSDDKVGK